MFEVFKKNWKWFLFPIGIILVYGLFLIFKIYPISEFSIEKAGQFGDSFGIINTLFSGSAFIALVITIYLQQQDIKDSKREIQKQNFENTFFNLIKIHNDFVGNFREYHILNDGTQHFMYGGESISFFLDKFKKSGFSGFYTPNENLSHEENKEQAEKNRNIDPKILKLNIKLKLGRKNLKFIENVYSILNLIDRASFLDEKDKIFYLETLHAQISDEELVLIFYYTLAIYDNKKLLLEKYQFFKNLNTQLLHNCEEEILLYKKEAFDEQLWYYFL
jgi:uncharacterized membrane protein